MKKLWKSHPKLRIFQLKKPCLNSIFRKISHFCWFEDRWLPLFPFLKSHEIQVSISREIDLIWMRIRIMLFLKGNLRLRRKIVWYYKMVWSESVWKDNMSFIGVVFSACVYLSCKKNRDLVHKYSTLLDDWPCRLDWILLFPRRLRKSYNFVHFLNR